MTQSFKRRTGIFTLTALVALLSILTGCQTTEPQPEFQDYEPGVWAVPQQQQPAAMTEAAPPAETAPPATGQAPGRTDVFRVGDVVVVTFSGTSETITPHEERIKEDGTITLSLVGSIKAAGKSSGELQHELQKNYDKFYKTLVVTVRSFSRFYYVGGEVKRPGAQQYLGETSVTKAIQAAGDFTDFARKNAIRVIRADGTALTVNFGKLIDDPSLDPPIYPGDKIHVPRRVFPWQ